MSDVSSARGGIGKRAAAAVERHYVFAVLIIGGAIAVAWVLHGLLIATGGHLVYPLDDAYIALALSEGIARGQYGINPGEVCSPSSSILYPFLLAPAAGTRIHVVLPLVLNIAGTVVSLWAIARIVELANVAMNLVARHLIAVLLFACLLFINMFGVIFVGLEHALHIAASLVILAGLIAAVERGTVPVWLLAGIVLAPLIRFEGIAASLAALLALVCLRAWRNAVVSAALLAVCLGLYFLGMHLLDLPLLPVSVTAKAALAKSAQAGDVAGLLHAVLERWASVPRIFEAKLLVVMAGLAVVPSLVAFVRAPGWRHLRPATVPMYVAAVTLGHATGGAFHWFERYDVYALAVGAIGLFYIYRPVWRWMLDAMTPPLRWPVGLPIVARFLLAVGVYAGVFELIRGHNGYHWEATRLTPLAAQNVYEQQGQMSRFAREFYRAPVAITDLGFVAWRNPHYVLDLAGLCSQEVRRMRLAQTLTPQGVRGLVARHNVGLAMLYSSARSKRIDWEPVAYLRLGTPLITPTEATVVFVRTQVGSAEKIAAALRGFRRTLPPGVTLDLWPECGKRVKLDALNVDLKDGAAADDPRVTPFRCPLTVELPRPMAVSKVRMQVGTDDIYAMRLLKDGKEVGFRIADADHASGLRTRAIELPAVLADNIEISGQGDNRYSVGRFEVNDGSN